MLARQKLLDCVKGAEVAAKVTFNGVEDGRVEAVITAAKADDGLTTGLEATAVGGRGFGITESRQDGYGVTVAPRMTVRGNTV